MPRELRDADVRNSLRGRRFEESWLPLYPGSSARIECARIAVGTESDESRRKSGLPAAAGRLAGYSTGYATGEAGVNTSRSPATGRRASMCCRGLAETCVLRGSPGGLLAALAHSALAEEQPIQGHALFGRQSD